MTDIAELGLAIRSDGVVVATDRLKLLERQSKSTEMAANTLKAVFAVVAAGAVAMGIGVAGAIKRLEESERMARQFDRALANTGNTARTSSREVAAWAEELEYRTGRAAEEVMKVSTNLATFGFGRETFFRAIELADDMAAAWGGDLKQNLEGLSRALDDPEKGFAMLQKRGVQLSDTQKQLVKDLMDTNDKLGAQGVVFEALEAQVKGVAEDGYDKLPAAIGRAKEAWDTAFEDMVRGEGDAGDLRDSLVTLAQTVSSPEYISSITQFGTVFVNVLKAIADGAVNAMNNVRMLMDFAAGSHGDLAGMSTDGLNGKLREIGLKKLELDNLQMSTQSQIDRGDTGLFGMNKGALEGQITAAREQVTELIDQERQILSIIEKRNTPAETGPAPGTMEGYGFVDPYEGQNFNAIDEATEAQKAFNEARQEGLAITEAMRTPEEALQENLSHLSELLAAGHIDWETYSRAVKEAMDTVAVDTGAMVGKVGDILGSLASIMQSSGEKGFGIAKGLSLAQAVLKGYEAVTSAYAAGAAIPGVGMIMGPLYAAAAFAATSAQIANIMATTSKTTSMKGASGSSAPSAPSAPVAAPAQAAGPSANITVYGDSLNRKGIEDLVKQIQKLQNDRGGKLNLRFA